MSGLRRQSQTLRRAHPPATPSIDQALRAAQEQIAVARYIADMTAQLETMATAARLDLLAYFLAMARAESESSARLAPPPEPGEPGPAHADSLAV